jgi:hypothetical protein
MRTLLTGICIAAAAGSAAQGTSGTLKLGAFDHEGKPLPDIAIVANTGGSAEREVKTGADGLARLVLEGPPLRATARLAEPRPYYPVADVLRGANRTIAFRVYGPDPGQYGDTERADFVANFLSVVRSSHADALPAATREIAAFLHTNRRESLEGMDTTTVPADQASITSVRVVSPLGAGLPDRVVFAYGVDPANGLIRIAASERTDKDGYAIFRDLLPDRLYRLETGARGEEVAISSFFRTSAGAALHLPPAISLEPSRAVRGVVLWDGKPVSGVTVTTANEAEQPSLTTTTDAFGSFLLGPLNPGIVALKLHRRDLTGDRSFPWSQATGLEETMIPMELLAPRSLNRGAPAP